jgi:hypothetical protein
MTLQTIVALIADGLKIASIIDPPLGMAASAVLALGGALDTPEARKAEAATLAAIQAIFASHGVTPDRLATATARAHAKLASAVTDQDRAMWARTDNT